MAGRSAAWVCGRSLAGNAGSNPIGGMGVVLLWVLCVVVYRFLRRTDHSSYRVWCVWVWSWSFGNEKSLAHWGLLRHKENSNKLSVALKREEAYISCDLTLEFMVVEVFVLLECDAAEVRVWVPTFWDSLSVLSSRVLNTLILEEGKDRMSQNLVTNHRPTLCNTLEFWRPQKHTAFTNFWWMLENKDIVTTNLTSQEIHA